MAEFGGTANSANTNRILKLLANIDGVVIRRNVHAVMVKYKTLHCCVNIHHNGKNVMHPKGFKDLKKLIEGIAEDLENA